MTIATKNRLRKNVVQAPRQTESFRELDADLFLANQLFRYGHGSQILSGATSSAERVSRIRRAIFDGKLSDRPVLDQRGVPLSETLSAAFERLYRARL